MTSPDPQFALQFYAEAEVTRAAEVEDGEDD